MPTTIDSATAAKLRASEPAILEALKARADAPRKTDLIVIPDADGEPLFAFTIHALSDTETQRLLSKHSPRTKDEETGIEIDGDLNLAAYRAEVIIEATEAEDRKALWNNPDLLKAYGVRRSLDLVDRLIPPGLKVAICLRIDALGQYGSTLPRVESVASALGKSSAPTDD